MTPKTKQEWARQIVEDHCGDYLRDLDGEDAVNEMVYAIEALLPEMPSDLDIDRAEEGSFYSHPISNAVQIDYRMGFRAGVRWLQEKLGIGREL